jgi:class 3 adenylate cyclase
MTQQLKDAFERIEAQNKELAKAYDTIRLEKEKSDRLLLNILPARVADDLKQTGTTTPELFENATVLLSDLVGFAGMSSQLDPRTLIDELNDLFTAFDTIIEENRCERIKTIGDAYLAVCGMPEPNRHHAENILNSALKMVQYLTERRAKSRLKWEIRIGVHSGSVVGGVVGVKKYIYDVFGDTINTASRMESNSAPMRVNVSEATYALVEGKFNFAKRETCEVKGKGRMRMYFLEPDN